MKSKLSRRDFLKLGGAGLITATSTAVALTQNTSGNNTEHKKHLIQPPLQMDHGDGEGLPGVGDVDFEKNGFNPTDTLYDFDYGKVSTLPNGQTLRELCKGHDMTRQAVTKHLALLQAANLVVTRKQGREKLHFLNPVPIHGIADRWIDKYERSRLRALADLKNNLEGKRDEK